MVKYLISIFLNTGVIISLCFSFHFVDTDGDTVKETFRSFL